MHEPFGVRPPSDDERFACRGSQCPSQLIVGRERDTKGIGQRVEHHSLAGKQVLKETRRPAHGLTRVIDDVIETRQPFEQETRV